MAVESSRAVASVPLFSLTHGCHVEIVTDFACRYGLEFMHDPGSGIQSVRRNARHYGESVSETCCLDTGVRIWICETKIIMQVVWMVGTLRGHMTCCSGTRRDVLGLVLAATKKCNSGLPPRLNICLLGVTGEEGRANLPSEVAPYARRN